MSTASFTFQQHEPTAARRTFTFYAVDVTNGYTPEPSLNYEDSAADVQVSKNGGAFANATGVVTEVAEGVYQYVAAVAELDTLGSVTFKFVDAAARVVIREHQVVPAGPYLAVGAAVTTDAGNSTTSFETDLGSSVNDFYNGAFLVFVSSAALDGQVRRVADYNGSTKIITLASPLTVTPTVGDKFVLINS